MLELYECKPCRKSANTNHEQLMNMIIYLISTNRLKKVKSFKKQYGTDRGGRDSTGSTKFLDAKCWANKLF